MFQFLPQPMSLLLPNHSWSFKSSHPSGSLNFEGPIASKWSVSEKSHSSPVRSSSFITDCGIVPGTPSQLVLHARGNSRDCSGGGVGLCFSLGAPASVATVPRPPSACRDPRDCCRCAFFLFFFPLLGALALDERASRASRGAASDGDGDGTVSGGLMSSAALHHDGIRSE